MSRDLTRTAAPVIFVLGATIFGQFGFWTLERVTRQRDALTCPVEYVLDPIRLADDKMRPAFEAPDIWLGGVDDSAEVPVHWYSATYLTRAYGPELINYRNEARPISGWSRKPAYESVLDVVDQGAFARNRAVYSSDSEVFLYESWYVIGGTTTQSRTAAKVLAIPQLFATRRDASLVVAAARCVGDCAGAQTAIRHWLAKKPEFKDPIAMCLSGRTDRSKKVFRK